MKWSAVCSCSEKLLHAEFLAAAQVLAAAQHLPSGALQESELPRAVAPRA
jgi:hypothetical protein